MWIQQKHDRRSFEISDHDCDLLFTKGSVSGSLISKKFVDRVWINTRYVRYQIRDGGLKCVLPIAPVAYVSSVSQAIPFFIVINTIRYKYYMVI